MITVSEDSKRMADLMKMYGMAGMDSSMYGGMGETLIVNVNNALVKYILDNPDGENTGMFCEQLYDLALVSHAPLKPEQMAAFVAKSNRIMGLLAK